MARIRKVMSHCDNLNRGMLSSVRLALLSDTANRWRELEKAVLAPYAAALVGKTAAGTGSGRVDRGSQGREPACGTGSRPVSPVRFGVRVGKLEKPYRHTGERDPPQSASLACGGPARIEPGRPRQRNLGSAAPWGACAGEADGTLSGELGGRAAPSWTIA